MPVPDSQGFFTGTLRGSACKMQLRPDLRQKSEMGAGNREILPKQCSSLVLGLTWSKLTPLVAPPTQQPANFMVEINVTYEGGLRTRAIHGPSKTELVTDAPVDNMGKGESFSPTDLMATALASCIATTIGIVAQRKGVEVTGMRVRTEKHMSTDTPRRIVRLPTTVWMPLPSDSPERALFENTAHGCPVHQSLRKEIEIPIEFVWEG
jgi:uncharacterized OsmC-like protein